MKLQYTQPMTPEDSCYRLESYRWFSFQSPIRARICANVSPELDIRAENGFLKPGAVTGVVCGLTYNAGRKGL